MTVIVPDMVSPIVATRVWQWDSLGLRSLNDELWFPGQALEAKCSWGDHAAPADGHTCGIYAARDLSHLRRLGYAGVVGNVYLWGKVWEHAYGYRAQYAYPMNLTVTPDLIPLFNMSEAESRLTMLCAYSVPISIASGRGGQDTIPLWDKESGFGAGLEYLVERSKLWYSRSRGHPALAAGERVSVRGIGIGVAESVDSSEVSVRMWNRLSLRLPRQQVVWSDQNWRWESSTAGFVRGELSGAAARATV